MGVLSSAVNMASMLGSKVEERRHETEKPIDREKTCPLLLRVFCNNGRHGDLTEYRRGNVPPNELQVYTWLNATLKELSSLVLEVNPDARRKGTIFDFSIIYPELKAPVPRMRNIGQVIIGQEGFNDQKTLAQCSFVIGDYLDIAITTAPFQRGPNYGPPGPNRRM